MSRYSRAVTHPVMFVCVCFLFACIGTCPSMCLCVVMPEHISRRVQSGATLNQPHPHAGFFQMAICKTWSSAGPLLRLRALPRMTALLPHLSLPSSLHITRFTPFPQNSPFSFHFHTSCALHCLIYLSRSARLRLSVTLRLCIIYSSHCGQFLFLIFTAYCFCCTPMTSSI